MPPPVPTCQKHYGAPLYLQPPMQDLLLLSQHATCQAAASRSTNFAAAAALLRVWAAAQQVDSGADGLSGFLLTSLLAELILKGAVVSGWRQLLLLLCSFVWLSRPSGSP